MGKTVVVYWSGTGNTGQMATEIAGAVKTAGGKCDLFMVSETTAEDTSGYDNILLGCPAMGSEVLEEAEFEHFFAELEGMINGKNVGLFGSYGWGDGEWMRNWQKRVSAAGATLIGGEGVIANEAPDADALVKCAELGKTAAAL